MKKFLLAMLMLIVGTFALPTASFALECDAGYISDGTSCTPAKFSITTTTNGIAANGTFQFYISARGTFYVDCGDGGVLSGTGASGNTITKGDTTNTLYTCTYGTAGTKTIMFGGEADNYNTDTDTAAISFYKSSGGTQTKIASVSGNMSAVFPYKTGNTATGAQPRFYQTFYSASNLTDISGTLFANYTTGANYMFQSTFYYCTSLTTIPSNLFSGITTGADSMFNATFSGCTNLAGYIPPTTFAGLIANGHPTASNMWYNTFANTAVSESCPSTMTQYITGYEGSTNGTTWNGKVACVPDCGAGKYLPAASFACSACAADSYCDGTSVSYSYNANSAQGIGTCPANSNSEAGAAACTCSTGYSVTGKKAGATTTTTTACSPIDDYAITYNLGGGTNYSGAPTTYTYGTGATIGGIPTKAGQIFTGWTGDNGSTPQMSVTIGTGATGDKSYTANWTAEKFSATTGALSAGTAMFVQLSAVGTFYVNWGDGTIEPIVRTDTTLTEYSHTYTSAGTYTIGFGGVATNYSDDTSVAAISFYKPANGNSGRIVSVSGDLSALFPYITANSSSGAQPRFVNTFQQASLTSVPATLFSGYTIGADNMFNSTFMLCTSLTTIPAGLFSGITTGASNMFQSTFRACRSIVTIPTGLFNGLTTGASYMFQSTFLGCTSLTTIPSTLFSGITTGAQGMFATIFYGCTSLTTIPSGLFSGITTGARGMFTEAFAGCTNLTTIPSNLFGGITTSVDVDMFAGTFGNCTSLTTIPGGLFSGITASAGGLFKGTFSGCTSLATIPSNLFGGITAGAAELFRNTFKNCTSLTSVTASLFSNVTATSGARQLFQDTFNGCTGLTAIPAGLFSSVTNGASQMFSGAFNGCTSLAGYIPPTTFAGLVANGHPTAIGMWADTFSNTQLVTSCPTYTTQYITGYEGSGATTWNGKVACVPDCGAGKYLPAASFACSACAADSYCDGTSVSYSYNANSAQGIAACPTGMYAPAGMWESGQCGRILHIGDQVVYLRNTKKTTPSLHLDIDNDGVPDLFGNMTTQDVPMTSGSEHKLKLSYNNTTYSVYDDSVSLNP